MLPNDEQCHSISTELYKRKVITYEREVGGIQEDKKRSASLIIEILELLVAG